MNQSKLREIYGKNNHHHVIKASDLQNDYIKYNDDLAIKNFSSKLSLEYFKKCIIFLFFNLSVGFLFYDFIKTADIVFTQEFFLIASLFISLIAILFHLLYMLYLTSNNLYKKTQYGVIKTKFYRKHFNSTNHRIKKKYYAHVIFPSNNTLITNVQCTEDTYNSISQGSKVLVISFDNKTTHIVLI